MADASGSVTPEGAALQLLRMIAHAEGKSLTEGVPAGQTKPDRDWIIRTYRLCLLAAQHPQQDPKRLLDEPGHEMA
jgi:hypothetical protein